MNAIPTNTPQAKAKLTEPDSDGARWLFFKCPACKMSHGVPVTGSRAWAWNQSLTRPTLSPSLLVTMPPSPYRCHFFLVDSRIYYLGDCSHEMKGQTVELPDPEAAPDSDPQQPFI